MVVRRTLLNGIGGFRTGYEGAQDYDLLLRLMERTAAYRSHPARALSLAQAAAVDGQRRTGQAVGARCGPLALEDHVKRNGIDAEVVPGAAPGLYRVRRRIRDRPLVSIIIPTAGRPRDIGGKPVDLLANAISSVMRKTAYDAYEFIIVADDAGVAPTTAQALEGTRHSVLRFDAAWPVQLFRKINAGAAARGGRAPAPVQR